MIVLAGVVRALGCECHRHGSRDLARAWRGAFRISRERGMAWCRRATWQYCRYCLAVLPPARALTPRPPPRSGPATMPFWLSEDSALTARSAVRGCNVCGLCTVRGVQEGSRFDQLTAPYIRPHSGARSHRRARARSQQVVRRARVEREPVAILPRQCRQYCRRSRGGHRPALDPREDLCENA